MKPTLDVIGIIVDDLNESLRFYRDLGLPIEDAPEGPHVECVLPNGLRITWDTIEVIRSFDPDWNGPRSGRIGLAFLCENPAAVDAKYRDMVGGGYHGHKEPWDAFWGQRYAQLHDPDGNCVDLFAPLST